MQAVPPILPLVDLPNGDPAPPRSAERHANLVKFQSELEVSPAPAHPTFYLYTTIERDLSQIFDMWNVECGMLIVG